MHDGDGPDRDIARESSAGRSASHARSRLTAQPHSHPKTPGPHALPLARLLASPEHEMMMAGAAGPETSDWEPRVMPDSGSFSADGFEVAFAEGHGAYRVYRNRKFVNVALGSCFAALLIVVLVIFGSGNNPPPPPPPPHHGHRTRSSSPSPSSPPPSVQKPSPPPPSVQNPPLTPPPPTNGNSGAIETENGDAIGVVESQATVVGTGSPSPL
jgi:hypothetical protein